MLRIEMIRRVLTYHDLAKLAGIVPQRVANLLSNNDRSWPMRAKINQALRMKIFHKPGNTRRKIKAPANINKIEV